MMLCVDENSSTNEITHPVSTPSVVQSPSLVTSQLPTRERAGILCKINVSFLIIFSNINI